MCTKRLCLNMSTGLYRAQTELEECLLYFGLSKNVKNETSKEYPAQLNKYNDLSSKYNVKLNQLGICG